ncbi:MAG: restriction endonuclease [Campylobacterales bacterium]|nr:restriction endonuclease [Campylobacterales bacterium]
MLSAINHSTTYFCSDILGFEVTPCTRLGASFFGASIPLTCNAAEHHFYLFFEDGVLNNFGEILLGESPLCEADLDDLCKEVANQIIGHAKVSLEKQHPQNHYQLGTPEFLGEIPSPLPVNLEEFLLYELEGHTFLIGQRTTL